MQLIAVSVAETLNAKVSRCQKWFWTLQSSEQHSSGCIWL